MAERLVAARRWFAALIACGPRRLTIAEGAAAEGRSSSSNPDRRRPHPSRVWVAGRMAGTGCSDVRHRDVLVTDTWAHVSSAQMYSLVWRVFVMGFDSCTNPELFIF